MFAHAASIHTQRVAFRKRNAVPGSASKRARAATLELGAPVDVVATQAHAASLLEILGGRGELPVLAELRVEPYNPVGVQVVGVYVDGRMVGRLPRDVAERRRDEFTAVAAARGAVIVAAVVRAAAVPQVVLEPQG